MIRSMTGFGRGEAVGELGRISVEMKSVNHRYLDLGIKMPRKLNPLEGNIRSFIKDKIYRGKVDIYINFEGFSEENVSIHYNKTIAKEYMEYFRQMSEEFSIDNDVKVSRLSAMPEVFSMIQGDDDEEGLWLLLKEALSSAVDEFLTVRDKEGEQLAADLLSKLDYMGTLVDAVEERYPQILADYRERLRTKLSEVIADTELDENRIAAEVVIFADKCCVDEETVRLKSHIRQVADALGGPANDSVGRRLDFLVQEMNREANTMLSKSADMTITDVAINIKTEIEKIREQVQNIE
ncbi:MAG: YicC family protein [Lachnospiraceae bacterium]|nr:YicC family protein [Lachnospiraceae bacterium]